jgi:hypothetical protein
MRERLNEVFAVGNPSLLYIGTSSLDRPVLGLCQLGAIRRWTVSAPSA